MLQMDYELIKTKDQLTLGCSVLTRAVFGANDLLWPCVKKLYISATNVIIIMFLSSLRPEM